MTATVDGASAIAWMRAKKTNEVGWCLATCWDAYASKKTGSIGASYPTALSAWNAATQKHAGDRNPPAGAAVWLGASPTRTDANAGAGDVAISLGGGQIIATDYPTGGVIGVTTIAAREAQTARPYLGWTGDICGYSIILAATGGETTTEGDGMSLIKFLDDPGQPVFLFTAGRIKHMGTNQEANVVANAESIVVHQYHHDDCQKAIYAYANTAISYAQVLALSVTKDATGRVVNYNRGGEWIRPVTATATIDPTALEAAVSKAVAGIKIPTKLTITGEAVSA
ncbi:hypothetical protein [Humibacter sp. RRB41]|uniref:hypothetical protein n=1 Tax=Humibacter sp. RRB41 TaxID=2919946 RepID=UPI001FAA7A0C|nr:hypothetical protein [Humibacter sp. RRB41]